MTDATNVMRGILLRQALYAYLRHIFPKLADSISQFGHWKWFSEEYGMSETGRLKTDLPNNSTKDPDSPGNGIHPSSEDPSRFASKAKLTKLCTMVATGKHDWGFTQLGKTQGHALSLDLSAESMRTLKGNIHDIWTDYIAELPPSEFRRRCRAPRWTLRTVRGM